MKDVSCPASSLFYRLRLLRGTLPLAFSLTAIAYEFVEHGFLAQPVPRTVIIGEVVVFAIIGPLLVLIFLTWLLHRVIERDVAEARLAVLYEASREIGASHSLDELQEIALSVPERAGLQQVACVLIIQEGPGQPWLLARTRGFGDPDVSAIQMALARRQDQPDCAPEQGPSPYLKTHCPLLGALSEYLAEPRRLALSLSLSREPSRRVMMGVYLPAGVVIPANATEILEPLAAGLALAMDRASLRAHERQLLQQVQRDVLTQQLGLQPTFERILAHIAAEHPISAGAVYLLRDEGRRQRLACMASWPDADASRALADSALASIMICGKTGDEQGRAEVAAELAISSPYVLALPITSEDELLGVLVLAGQGPTCLPHPSVLDVVISMMALLMRNSQLYGRLESQAVLEERNRLAREVHDGVAQALGFYNFKVQQVQRLLERGNLAEAKSALQELRSGSQEVYQEVRRMVQDLSRVGEQANDLVGLLRSYCNSFATRTGLDVSLELAPAAELLPDAQVELFRVVQEALNNAHRHARAHRVCVALSGGADGVTLTVEDDGAGLPPGRTPDNHFGLRIMRQRVESIGGQLHVESPSGKGTTVSVRVPAPGKVQRQMEESWSEFVS